MKIEFKNIDKLSNAIDLSDIAVVAATRMAINDVLIEIAAKADDLIPFDEGTLSRSQRISPPRIKLEGSITYGGAAAPYALVQHENPDYRHSPGRVYKYLESPARQVGEGIGKRIADLIKKAT